MKIYITIQIRHEDIFHDRSIVADLVYIADANTFLLDHTLKNSGLQENLTWILERGVCD
jgi:hypothetical protein